MAVGIVAGQRGDVDFEQTAGIQPGLQLVVDFRVFQMRGSRAHAVAVDQDRAVAVAIDGASLEFEQRLPEIEIGEQLIARQDRVDTVVQARLVATAPAVEVEIQRETLAGIAHGDGPEITAPGVVVTHLDKVKAWPVAQSLARDVIARGYQQYDGLAFQRYRDETGIFLLDLVKHVLPVAPGKRPGKHDSALLLPFRGQPIVDRMHMENQPFGSLPDRTAPR